MDIITFIISALLVSINNLYILSYECRDDCCNGRFGSVPNPWDVVNCTETGPECPDKGYLLYTTQNRSYCITGNEDNKGNHPQTIGAIFENCSSMNVGPKKLIKTPMVIPTRNYKNDVDKDRDKENDVDKSRDR